MSLLRLREVRAQAERQMDHLSIRNALEMATRSLKQIEPASIVRRATSSTSACSSGKDGDTCQKPTTADGVALPVALGIGWVLL